MVRKTLIHAPCCAVGSRKLEVGSCALVTCYRCELTSHWLKFRNTLTCNSGSPGAFERLVQRRPIWFRTSWDARSSPELLWFYVFRSFVFWFQFLDCFVFVRSVCWHCFFCFLFRELSLLRFFVFKKPARSLDVAWLSQNSDKVCGRSLTRLDSSTTTTFPKFKIWMMRALVCTLVAIRNVR